MSSGREKLAKLLERAPAIAPRDAVLKTTRLIDVIAKPIEPLWPGVLYRGKVTVIAGLPGDGKSVMTVDLAARISSGARWPVGVGRFSAAPVALLTAEDDPADTIRPRLDAAGANTAVVELIEGAYRTDAEGRRTLDMVSLAEDLPAIEDRLTQQRPSLLIADPLTSFAGSDTNKTADARRLLDGLSQMATRTGVAVLVVTHLNKRSDARKAMQMIAGSHVLVAAVRVALVTARDPNDRDRRLLLPIKLNIARDEGGFAFRITSTNHSVCGDVPRVEWEAERVRDLTADEALIDSTPRAQAAVQKACAVQDWLRDLLRHEPVAARRVWEQAKERGYSERRVRTALKAIGAAGEPLGFRGAWHYRLPDSGKEVTREQVSECGGV